MKVIGRTKNGWMVDATLEELNAVTGLKVDKYGLGDQIEITPNLALAKDVAAKAARDAAILAKVPAYTGGQSITIGDYIIKSGYALRGGTTTTVKFGAAFPNGLVGVTVTALYNGGGVDNPAYLRSASASSIVVDIADTEVTGFYWMATGY